MNKLDEKQILQRVIELERKMDPESLGFSWHEVPAQPATLNRMVVNGILRVSYDSSTATYYRLAISPEEIEKMLEPEVERAAEEPAGIPSDLFAPLVGFDDIKETFLKSLKVEKPVHILLISPPATAAKSTFLMELERIPGARFVSFGGGTTRIGLRDVLAEAPKIVLLDEIDKVANPLDLSALMTWMESGRITINKHKEHREVRGKGYVFAAANTTRGLSPELLSRFMVFRIQPYNREQYIEVTKRVLTMREGVNPEIAGYVAERLASKGSRDVRDAIRVVRLCDSKEEVDRMIETIERYKG